MKNRNIRHTFAAFLVVALAAIAFGLIWQNHSFAETGTPDLQDKKLEGAGKLLLDAETNEAAVMPLTFDFVRSPDTNGADGKGRFLIAVNSGYGLMFNSKSKAQQTLAVIDLNAKPAPKVVQNIYFPSPQSANFGLVFDKKAQADGRINLYLSGGFENKIWILSFDAAKDKPLAPQNAPIKYSMRLR